MPLQNVEIAEKLEKMADLLDISGENPFKVRAYRNAAQTIEDTPIRISETLLAGESLPHLPGVGESISGKISELVRTGHLTALEELEQQMPASLFELTQIPGLGPKRVKALHEMLNINSLADLRQAVRKHQLQTLPGFGMKLEEKIRQELEKRVAGPKRISIAVAEQLATPLLDYLKTIPGIHQVEIAGSYRRRKETVGDLDILITGTGKMTLMQQILAYPEIHDILWQGETRSTIILKAGLQVDFRLIPPASYGAALLYFTGSKSHNIELRTEALEQGWKINEYGIYQGRSRLAGRTETEMYNRLGLPYIPPELRENRGEIEAARAGELPNLVTIEQIRGDLHTHTEASDGKNRIEDMARAAEEKGYEYLAITDHSQHTVVARGLDEKRMRDHLRRIDIINDRLEYLQLLKSAEVDILEDGSLDLPDALLKEMDIVICSVHYKFDLPVEQQTQRIIRAMDNRYFHILAHPTGRLLEKREGYTVHMDQIIRAAAERGCFLELNSQPMRLDLSDLHCRQAKNQGVKIALSSDAHTIKGLNNIIYGIGQARRGWLSPDDIVNTRRWPDLQRLLRH